MEERKKHTEVGKKKRWINLLSLGGKGESYFLGRGEWVPSQAGRGEKRVSFCRIR